MGTAEIRVHGVADRGPEPLLDRPIVRRVAGDEDAGFYRVRPGFGNPDGAEGGTLEAYHWSRLAGGTATRTFSLVLLLPFMLANIAIWMLPPGCRTSLAGKALCRLLAATLTAMYVLSIAGVALDLVAWQCAEYPRCLEGLREISWLGGVPPGQRLALLALLPILAIALLWWLGGRTWELPEDATSGQPGLGADRLDTRPSGTTGRCCSDCGRCTWRSRWRRSTWPCCWPWPRTTAGSPATRCSPRPPACSPPRWRCSAYPRSNDVRSPCGPGARSGSSTGPRSP